MIRYILILILFSSCSVLNKKSVNNRSGFLLLTDNTLFERSNGLNNIPVSADSLMPDVFILSKFDIDKTDTSVIQKKFEQLLSKKTLTAHFVFLYNNCDRDQRLRDSYLERGKKINVLPDSSSGYYSNRLVYLPVEMEYVKYNANLESFFLNHKKGVDIYIKDKGLIKLKFDSKGFGSLGVR